MASQPEFAQQWLQQWQSAAVELPLIHAKELRSLSDAEALSASDALLMLPGQVPAERWTSSGLVEQQRLFSRSRK
jgi:hypothetical protein